MIKIDKQNVIGSSLTGDAKEFVTIPESIIINSEMDIKRVAAYIFFWLWHGKNNKVMHSIESLVIGCGHIPNKHKDKSNYQFWKLMTQLQDIGYIENPNLIELEHSHTVITTTKFCNDWYDSIRNTERFARLYLDEINKIVDYDCSKGSKSVTSSNILLVFAYLRLKIIVRNTTECSENIESRKKSPEVYYRYYKDICTELGITGKTLSAILKILSKDLGLIYIEHTRKSYEDENGNIKWITYPTLFCNTYKRLQGKLIYDGSNYFLQETKNKINILNFDNIKKTNAKIEESETDMNWLELI